MRRSTWFTILTPPGEELSKRWPQPTAGGHDLALDSWLRFLGDFSTRFSQESCALGGGRGRALPLTHRRGHRQWIELPASASAFSTELVGKVYQRRRAFPGKRFRA